MLETFTDPVLDCYIGDVKYDFALFPKAQERQHGRRRSFFVHSRRPTGDEAVAFFQTAPDLANQYDDDRVLRSYFRRAFDTGALAEVEPSLREMGELAGGALYRLQLTDRLNEPRLVQWDAWGKRVDQIELTPLWTEAARIAATHGLVATAYERKHGPLSRLHQFGLAYLFDASTDVYTCPLAMTDGAAGTLSAHGGPAAQRALPHLLSRDPKTAWTSGQWMTERTGGSDVGLSETVARPVEDGMYRLYGTKWFTSATTSQMALTLGRPEGNGPGGRGLALSSSRSTGRTEAATAFSSIA